MNNINEIMTLAQFVSDWEFYVQPMGIRLGQWFIINYIAEDDNSIDEALWNTNTKDSLAIIKQFIYDNQWDEYALIPLEMDENTLP